MEVEREQQHFDQDQNEGEEEGVVSNILSRHSLKSSSILSRTNEVVYFHFALFL